MVLEWITVSEKTVSANLGTKRVERSAKTPILRVQISERVTNCNFGTLEILISTI